MFKVEDLQKFFDDSPSPHIGFKGPCHVCGKDVCVDMDMAADGKVTIKGGALYRAQTGATPEDTTLFLKCDVCYEKSVILKNFQPCEVYSRVIGYLRPISYWNDGKVAEFKLRKTFKIDK